MRKFSYNYIVAFCLFLAFHSSLNAQLFDSLVFKTGLQLRMSSQPYQPLWLVANGHGTVADRQTDLVPFVRVTNKHVLASSESQEETTGLYDYNDLTLSYGLSVYNNDHFKSTFIEEGYAKLEYKNWSLRAGRFEELPAEVDKDLSSGSFGVSGNALPIPKVGLAVTDYKNVPFTNGWVQFKGTFAHGWLGDNRYIKNSYYHEATFFLRFGARAFKVYVGAEHFAEWGGTRGTEQFGKGLSSFRDAVFIKETPSATHDGSHSGDHRGVIDGGLYWENNNLSLHGYLQKPFEATNDIGFGTMNGLAGISLSFKDRYTGLQKLVFEVINTTTVNNNTPVNQLESYYNNSVYKTGWEYQDNIIGTPLFLNRVRGSNYFPEIKPFDWNAPDDSIPGNANIINNRIFAVHAGALCSITGNLNSKTLVTYTKNMGSPTYGELFAPAKEQFYCLQQFSYGIEKYNLTLNAGVGFEFGQLSHNDAVGILVGLVWTIPVHEIAQNIFHR
jgi:Capsule assembly protein Wzi